MSRILHAFHVQEAKNVLGQANYCLAFWIQRRDLHTYIQAGLDDESYVAVQDDQGQEDP